MSRGVVLWLDPDASASIRLIWDALADRGLPSLATMTHQLHRPHVSLIVAEDLPVEPVLDAVGRVPRQSVPLEVENLGIFPQGVLFLSCIVNRDLLSEHGRHRQSRSSKEDGPAYSAQSPECLIEVDPVHRLRP